MCPAPSQHVMKCLILIGESYINTPVKKQLLTLLDISVVQYFWINSLIMNNKVKLATELNVIRYLML